jgi:hypothetical protein
MIGLGVLPHILAYQAIGTPVFPSASPASNKHFLLGEYPRRMIFEPKAKVNAQLSQVSEHQWRRRTLQCN